MDLFDVVRSCARRWYVFVPLLAIVTWFSYSAYTSVQPVYYSNAVIGMAAPSSRIDNPPQGIPIPRNGLLDVGGASFIANMTTLGLQEAAVVDRVTAGGGVPDYSVRMFPGPANMQQLPLIMIEATNADQDAVSTTLELVVAEAESTLKTLQQQANVPDPQMVVPFVVSPPSTPAAGTPARTRSTLMIFVAGLGLTVVVTVLFDVVLSRRTRRNKDSHAPSAATETQVPVNATTNGQPETVSALTSHGVDTNGNDRGNLRPE